MRSDPDTFFLSLTCKSVSDIVPKLPSLIDGIHALELRVDLLSRQDHDNIRYEVALLRHYSPPIPIIFTLRSKSQGGNWEGTTKEYFDILRLARRLNCEFIDIESHWDSKETVEFLHNRGTSYSIVSVHDYSTKASTASLIDMFKKVMKYDADVLKIIGYTTKVSDNFHIASALASLNVKKQAF